MVYGQQLIQKQLSGWDSGFSLKLGSTEDKPKSKQKGKTRSAPKPGNVTDSLALRLLFGSAIGGDALRRVVLTERNRAALEDAVQNADPGLFRPVSMGGSFQPGGQHYPDGLTGLQYYSSQLAPAAGVELAGLPVGSYLRTIRKSPTILKQMGIGESYALLDPISQFGTGGSEHYNAFARGPVAAYRHLLRNFRDVSVPPELSTVDGKVLQSYDAWLARKLDSRLSGALKDKKIQLRPEATDIVGLSTPAHELNTNMLSMPEQRKFLTDFNKSLTPAEREFIFNAEQYGGNIHATAGEYGAQMNNYLTPGKGVLKAHGAMRDASILALGGGLGGLLGKLIYRRLRDKKKQTARGDSIATAAGALTGGLGSFAMTNTGQYVGTQLNKAVSKLLQRLKK